MSFCRLDVSNGYIIGILTANSIPDIREFFIEIAKWSALRIILLVCLGFALIPILGHSLRIFTQGLEFSSLVPEVYFEAAVVFFGCFLLFIIVVILTRVLLRRQR